MKRLFRLVGVAALSASLGATACVHPAKSQTSGAPHAAPAASTLASPPAKPAAVVDRPLEGDTVVRTASGATFEAPKGWFLTQGASDVRLHSPERDVWLSVLEVRAPDALAAIEQAWRTVNPRFEGVVHQTSRPPARDGWEAVTQIVYRLPNAPERVALAVARRKAGTEYVVLLDGTQAAFDRRTAQLMTVLSTLEVPGIERESLAGRLAHALDPTRSAALSEFIEQAMAKSRIPGAAMAVVQDGKVVYERGFGVRELGKVGAVTPSTLFLIGSTSKSLTTLLMAALVDEGRFTWDTPLARLLPDFTLADERLAKSLTMQESVCACAGLPRRDLEFMFGYDGATPEQRVRSMRSMAPTTAFGETFQYSNWMVGAGGFAAARAAFPTLELGEAYDRAMQSRVFGPLGMSSSTSSFSVARSREHGAPHAESIGLGVRALPLRIEGGVIAVRPAGGVWSSVRDMEKYLAVELAKGQGPRGDRLFSERNLLVRREPRVKITDKLSYGMGLFVEEQFGVSVVHHGGNNVGYTSDMYLLPDHGVGAVLLTNAGEANAFTRAVRRRLFEILFDARDEARSWLDFALAKEREAMEQSRRTLEPFDPRAEWVASIIGRYRNADLGEVVLRADADALVLDAGPWQSRVARKKLDGGEGEILLLDPPAPGLRLLPASGPPRALIVSMGQMSYEFVAVDAAPSARVQRAR